MIITKRISMMRDIFDMITYAQGRNEKQRVIDTFVFDAVKEDFNFCIEVLAGKHKLGYSIIPDYERGALEHFKEEIPTIEYFYRNYLEGKDASYRSIDLACSQIQALCNGDKDNYDFFVKLCNRQYRIGIGHSLLDVSDTAPMLAELYGKKPRVGTYIVTEKFDGVRCISYYDGNDWIFVSRNGKPLKIFFDMSTMDADYIYDGELLIKGKGFNYVDGVINSIEHKDKGLVTYNIFDMYQNSNSYAYKYRRILIEKIKCAHNVKIVPVLLKVTLPEDEGLLMDKFLEVTSRGGEGVMLNEVDSHYKHKRGSHLLKLKDTWSLDMRVIGLKEGKGKYEGMIGSLECEAYDETYGTIYRTFAGGLSDAERTMTDWIGKIVEIACNGKSQNSKTLGSRVYSIRHARFLRRRDDKNKTSTD